MQGESASKVEGSTTQDVSTDYEVPAPIYTSFSVLKDRIRYHYERCSDYYYSLWGEHIHHGYFISSTDTKESAQVRLLDLLIERSQLAVGSTVLDVGCGIGGTSRYLAKQKGCKVVGITISGRQVEIAKRLTAEQAGLTDATTNKSEEFQLGAGQVRYLELDAETMGDYFGNTTDKTTFDCVWILEAMSHLPDKALFFRNAQKLLKAGGNLIVADWFKNENLTDEQMEADIKPIEDGMLLPPLCTQTDYVNLAKQAGLEVFAEPFDISKDVSRTWDLAWSLVQSPSLWAFAFSQGRDFIAFLQAFRAMRRGYANGTFRYAQMTFQKRQ